MQSWFQALHLHSARSIIPSAENRPWGGCGSGDRQGQYSGMLDCFVKSFRSGGLGAFYQGFLPNFARLGSWNVVMFLTMEQARVLVLTPCPQL